LAIPFLLKTLKCLLSRIPYRSIVATTTDIRIGNATLLKFLVSSTCEGCVTVSLSLPLWCCWLSLSPKERISSLVCCHTRFFRYSVNMHGLFNDWWCCRTIHCVNQSRHPCCLWPFDHLMTLRIVLRSDWLLVQGVSINACSQARSFETLRDRFNEWCYTVQCRRKELAIVTKSSIFSTFRETCLATETDTGSWHGRVLYVAMSHETCLRQA
jgi:hypothetical protein